jgi:protein TonB
MEMGKILSADVLDIIFDQRNKEYGAYDLRKNYQRRLTKSLAVTLLVVVLLCLTYILLGSMKKGPGEAVVVHDLALEKIPEKEKPLEKIPPVPQKIIPPQEIRVLKSTPPVIVKGEVPDDEKPPLNDDLDNAKIGTVNSAGNDDDGAIRPPVNEKNGVVDAPKNNNDDDAKIFTAVEIESKYPGGVPAWSAFLYRRLAYPPEASDAGIQGTVIVRFIVDKEGNVSEVEAISGPEELLSSAVSVIKKSGRWEPAIQNGRKVNSYKKQPITFKLNDE